MEQYISKSALVAWAKETYLCENASMIRKVCYKQLLEHLDTLEVKDVDLDLEITLWANAIPEIRLDDIERLAKHFFELGLSVNNKAEKGE